jgi:hypothetical protein
MKNYKLREGENIRKPVVKRAVIEIRVPILLICLALAFVIWLYIVSLSKINPADPMETLPPPEQETASAVLPAPDMTCELACIRPLCGMTAGECA